MSREIRQLPSVEDRVETGAVQFGDDWPGLFIRGDWCFGIRQTLGIAAHYKEEGLTAEEAVQFILGEMKWLECIIADHVLIGTKEESFNE